ncbi:hypothetical protein B7494_g297 [Chlorociboria aeruginascens]|nr:hypothetical protein B7494_g297 [Chlorociboria aeruginascens]
MAKFDLPDSSSAMPDATVNGHLSFLGPSRSATTLDNQAAEQQCTGTTITDHRSTKCLATLPNEVLHRIFRCKAAGLDLLWNGKTPNLLVALRGTALHEVGLKAYREKNTVVSAANEESFAKWNGTQLSSLRAAKFIIPEADGWVADLKEQVDTEYNGLIVANSRGPELEPFLFGHPILAAHNLETLIFDLTQVRHPFSNNYALVIEILRAAAQLKTVVIKARVFQRVAYQQWHRNGCVIKLFNSMFPVQGRLVKSTGGGPFKQEWSVEKAHGKEFIKLGSQMKTDEDYKMDFEVWVWENDGEDLNGESDVNMDSLSLA